MKTALGIKAAGVVVALLATSCAQTAGGKSGADANWPAGETMKLIVSYSAGGTTDVMARSLAKALEKKLDVQIQVINEDGAGGQKAYTTVANSKPDGLTYGTINYPTILSTIVDKSKGATYKLEDLQPFANHVNDPRVVIVQPDSAYRTAKDLVDDAKADPRKLKGATSGLSGGGHFSMIKLEEATGADFAPVHFNTGQAEAKAAFLGRHVQVYFASVGDGLELIKTGKGRAVGVADAQRSKLLPNVPTFAEQGIDIQEAGMRGYALPAGVPKEKVDKLTKAFQEIITSPQHQRELAKLSLVPQFMGPDAYVKWLKSQMPVVQRINDKSKNDK